ncbi:MAG: zinc dependent phospholipase C family protein [Lachnospiraceae bacterium]
MVRNMPNGYAHVYFGRLVKDRLESELQILLQKEIQLFEIGVHGPDIMFYYKALQKDPYNMVAHRMHDEPAGPFFEKSLRLIQNLEGQERDKALAYMLGFVCHFALDSSLHPYIEKQIIETGISHSEIETEFDKYLLKMQGINPYSFDYTSHVFASYENTLVISPFWDMPTEIVQKSLRSMKSFLALFDPNRKVIRAISFAVLKIIGKYEGMQGLFIRIEDQPLCIPVNQVMNEKLEGAISLAIELVDEFVEKYRENDTSQFSKRYYRDYCTEKEFEREIV